MLKNYVNNDMNSQRTTKTYQYKKLNTPYCLVEYNIWVENLLCCPYNNSVIQILISFNVNFMFKCVTFSVLF